MTVADKVLRSIAFVSRLDIAASVAIAAALLTWMALH